MTLLSGTVSAGGGARGPLDGWLPPDPAVPGAPSLGVPAAGLPPHLQVLLAAPLPVRGGHHGEQPPLQRTQHPLLPLQIGAGQHRTSINFGCWFVFYTWRPSSYHYLDNSYNGRFEWIGQNIQCLFNLKMSLSFTFVGFLFNAVVHQFKSVIDLRSVWSPLICDTLFIHYVMFYVSILIWLIVNI